ncbi:PTS system mannose/fructose/N-acetylgalactosamine-transporter subunit IIB [Ligilactobacillus cholophilus]|uniref:PTS system mannose/fructose/N-acetylgalactosamine-transporter subunit IIB n=1 Tax=Ligilactobacillus cholophilus TaxID=3050131 RepID=UPI002AA6A413|nr:PTS sugar transporter subunit IIB [uncultured Ligilactobacillus sp.]
MLQVQLLRIDSRLLHGQVATNWVRILKIDRIIVVSDQVATDAIRKTLIKQASPPGLKTNIVPVERLIRVNHDSRFDGMKVLILVENPQDALRLVLGGINVNKINIGSLSFTSSKQMVSDAVSVSKQDIEVFTQIHNQGIDLEVQKVSSNPKKDFWKILKDKHLVSDD